jgi:hypothetical protein
MRKITKVPNGPLVKKKGPYKGSTLKYGGKLKKAQNSTTTTSQTTKAPVLTWQQMTQAQKAAKKTELGPERFRVYKDSVSKDAEIRANEMFAKNAQTRGLTVEQLRAQNKKDAKKPDSQLPGLEIDKACKRGKTTGSCSTGESNRGESLRDTKRNGGPIKKAKAGGMIKRADGSYSKRGLWDNLRSKAAQNKKTGAKPKAPSKAMLTQEKRIKAKK